VEVRAAAPDQGGGVHTALRRIVAAVLDIGEDAVEVTAASTAELPFDSGVGSSRVTHVLGEAVRRGASELRARFDEPRPIEVLGTYEADYGATESVDYDFAALMIEVDVDPSTGCVAVVDAVLVADVGTIINPIAHQGQLDGGFVFGLGGALMEEVVVEDGQVVTLTLGDYKLPTVADVPSLRTVLVRTPHGPGPFGAKAVGELANGGVAPAIANAVAAAVGVRIQRLPITAQAIFHGLRTDGGRA
jgi:CO/xanthine dehydrogenase Mo-binding subunit